MEADLHLVYWSFAQTYLFLQVQVFKWYQTIKSGLDEEGSNSWEQSAPAFISDLY